MSFVLADDVAEARSDLFDERDFQATARRIARNASAVHSPANDEQIDAVGFGHVTLRTFSGAEPGSKACMLLNHRIFSQTENLLFRSALTVRWF